MSCVFIHRSMCSILYGIKASAGQGTSPTTDSYLDQKKMSKIAPSSTAPEAENLPVNIPS